MLIGIGNRLSKMRPTLWTSDESIFDIDRIEELLLTTIMKRFLSFPNKGFSIFSYLIVERN